MSVGNRRDRRWNSEATGPSSKSWPAKAYPLEWLLEAGTRSVKGTEPVLNGRS
jgi:hypothetical protein